MTRPGRSAPAAVVVVSLAIALLIPSYARAQASTPIDAGFDGGFFIQSTDGDNRLALGMIAQTDARLSTDAPNPIVNTFTLRKIRPTFTGRVGRYFEFKVMPDLGSGTTVVQDAYIDTRFSPKFRVRIGKGKTPVGYELAQSDAYLWFPERSLASSLVPNRDIGVSIQGDVLANRVFYDAGVFNGVPDGASTTTELDANGGKDLAGRVAVQPFRTAISRGLLNGIGVQIGGTTGKETGALPSFKTSAQQTYFSYASAAMADGVHTRVSPAVFYYAGPVGAFAEYVTSTQAVTRSTTTADVTNHGWDMSGTWFVTGEAATSAMVRPKHDFDPDKGHWGALQIILRYSTLSVDQKAFDLGFASTTASRMAQQFTLAANWYPNAFIKFYLTFEQTHFQDGAPRPTEHVVLLRAQLAFGDRR